jgi:hypothetical protein
MSKNLVETEGTQMTSQHGAYALRAGIASPYARMRIHKPKLSGTHMHARTRKHAHTGHYVILIAFPQQQWYVNAPHCYRIRTLLVLWITWCSSRFYKAQNSWQSRVLLQINPLPWSDIHLNRLFCSCFVPVVKKVCQLSHSFKFQQ